MPSRNISVALRTPLRTATPLLTSGSSSWGVQLLVGRGLGIEVFCCALHGALIREAVSWVLGVLSRARDVLV